MRDELSVTNLTEAHAASPWGSDPAMSPLSAGTRRRPPTISTILVDFERTLASDGPEGREPTTCVAALRHGVALLESALEEAQEKLGGSVQAWVADELRLTLLESQVCAARLLSRSIIACVRARPRFGHGFRLMSLYDAGRVEAGERILEGIRV
jgi:hypothetical protein